MDASERVVEAYVRAVQGWATIPNIPCDSQQEIDLLAVDPGTGVARHIEVSVVLAPSFHKLTGKPYDPTLARERTHQAEQRRTVGFFAQKKFAAAPVRDRLREHGLNPDVCGRAIVTWGWDASAEDQAREAGIALWHFPDLVRGLADRVQGTRTNFHDETLRMLNLVLTAIPNEDSERAGQGDAATPAPEPTGQGGFWIYHNWTNRRVRLHRETCSHCNGGRGTEGSASDRNGEWLGPFRTARDGWDRAQRLQEPDTGVCKTCGPADGA